MKSVLEFFKWLVEEAVKKTGDAECKYNLNVSNTLMSIIPLKVLGDDSLFVTPSPLCEAADIPPFFTKMGLTISDKTVITTNFSDIVFLGHNFYGARVTRDEFTCLSLALHTEDQIHAPQESILRIASLNNIL